MPPGWQTFHIDGAVEDIPWERDVDVVVITFHTPSANHAYRLAARFRARQICVVMGGPHVTLLPEEARQHAEGSSHWHRMNPTPERHRTAI